MFSRNLLRNVALLYIICTNNEKGTEVLNINQIQLVKKLAPNKTEYRVKVNREKVPAAEPEIVKATKINK